MKKKIIIISAPSGSGKTTFVKYLLSEFSKDLGFSISCTTRPIGAHETNAKDYYFITKKEFLEKINSGEFIEWEEVYQGVLYGTLRSEINRLWEKGFHVLFDIDVKGALNLKKQYPDDSLSIFIKPPSLEVLSHRIANRSRESLKDQNMRLKKATEELSFSKYFDEILLNDELDLALMQLKNKIEKFFLKSNNLK